MSVQNIVIAPENGAWVVHSDGALYERFTCRRDAVRHAAMLARRAEAQGSSAVVSIKSAQGERTRSWDARQRSVGL